MKILDIVCVEGLRLFNMSRCSNTRVTVAILQPRGLLFAVDGVAWERRWRPLIETGVGIGGRNGGVSMVVGV